MVKIEEDKLVLRERASTIENGEDVRLSIHSIPSRDGLIVRIQPPARPSNALIKHVPCDIVLVIDVSGSMQLPAPAKMNGDDGKLSSENFGLSILDMVKHAARTILSTMDERDRLGIVTFSTEARVVQKLLPMTARNKKLAESKINSMTEDSMTNLWHGIQKGISLFEGDDDPGRVPAVMILTDGRPNHMCPAQGYIPKIRSNYQHLPTTLHTFGFGYDIRSGLLKSIAEVGSGNYAFIPDAGMIGTVFVHAVAHLQTTYATECTLELLTPEHMRLKTTAGKTIFQQEQEEADGIKVTINLGNLQYGQSRDIYLENLGKQGHKDEFNAALGNTNVRAELKYSRSRFVEFHVSAESDVLATPDLHDNEIAYHQSRSMVCHFLSSLFPLQKDGEYETRKDIDPIRHRPSFRRLLENIPARLYNDEYNKSLMEDLIGNPPSGQVSLALSTADYFSKWGCHYFFSLWNAHAKQMCNSFKDPGPLMYNQNPFFAQCRDVLDKAFDHIPPPKQSRADVATTTHVQMSRINSRYNPCFTGSSSVALASGQQVPVRKLREGSRVVTPAGSRRVAAVLKTIVHRITMCKIAGLVVTPYHPVRIDDPSAGWTFPADLMCESDQPQVVIYSGAIYSVLLQPDRNVEAHALQIGGVWAVTLGHGLVRGDDVRAHRFLGNYRKVAEAITRLRPEKDGVALSSGVKRRHGDGLVCGFKRYVPQQHSGTKC